MDTGDAHRVFDLRLGVRVAVALVEREEMPVRHDVLVGRSLVAGRLVEIDVGNVQDRLQCDEAHVAVERGKGVHIPRFGRERVAQPVHHLPCHR